MLESHASCTVQQFSKATQNSIFVFLPLLLPFFVASDETQMVIRLNFFVLHLNPVGKRCFDIYSEF